jgi:uncharacterized membrane protein HdeD (DUF308 family)
MLRNIALDLVFAGAACIAIALFFLRAPDAGLFQTWGRGSFQRRRDYTVNGWRLYLLGIAIAIPGFVLLIIADQMGG